MTKWTKQEDALLLKKRAEGIGYKELLQYFPSKTQDALRNRFYIINNNNWIDEERISYFDIESTGLNADYDYMLSWVIRTEDRDFYDCINKEDLDSGIFDKRICESFVTTLEHLDVLVGYYSSRFDIPFIRTRCLINKVDFPAFGEKKQIDLYYSVKFKMKLSRNSLEAATRCLGIPGKNHVKGQEWMKARLGDRESLKYVLKHNFKDVEITEKLFYKLQKYCRFTKKSI
jgi:uncharacterized protein YprB with RNaseH-like and TPR domain